MRRNTRAGASRAWKTSFIAVSGLIAIACSVQPVLAQAQDPAAVVQTEPARRASIGSTSVAIAPDTGRVGDAYRVAVRIQLPAGVTPHFPDTVDVSGDVENSARSRVQVDSTQDGFTYTALYSLTGWRPGTLPLPPIAIPLTGADNRTITAALPPLQVASVLPADTSGIEARPPHDVWGASRLWWPLILAAVLLLLALAALLWWLRKRRANRAVVPIPAIESPRERVLRELAALEQQHWIERGEWKRFYLELTGLLRRYLATVDHTWGPDLTTSELAAILGPQRDRLMPVLRIFEHADLVKFARQHVSAAEARGDLQQAREWAESYEQPILEVAA